MTITKRIRVGDMLSFDPGLAYVLKWCGMRCVGSSSIDESLEDACVGQGLSVDSVLFMIAEYLRWKW